MKKSILLAAVALLQITLPGCNEKSKENNQDANKDTTTQVHPLQDSLPAPGESHTKLSKVTGWSPGRTPVAPQGFTVTKFAEGFINPRWIHVAPNGDIFVSEASTEVSGLKKVGTKIISKKYTQNIGNSANRITLLRDADKDGIPELRTEFLTGIRQPFGMLVLDNYFYVAGTEGLWRFPYKEGQTKITAQGEKLLELPAGGYNNHWTRNLLASEDGSRIYISVGSGSNNAEHGVEHEVRRANILEIHPDGSGERIYASGLRNPVGMAWEPVTKSLWTAVNERDDLGDELVPDYITSVRAGAFYGWPYAYIGPHMDSSFKGEPRPHLISQTIVPDYLLGAHTASLGLSFYNHQAFPAKYHQGAFVGQHGSWNSSKLVGYKVIFIPFKNGKPSGPPEDFLTGFIADPEEAEVYGRPVGAFPLPDGSMLVTDDAGNTIWRVNYKK